MPSMVNNAMSMNPYVPFPAVVRRTRVESEDKTLKTIELELSPELRSQFTFVPGQFCQISVLGVGEAPFGIASSPGEDLLQFTISKAGTLTRAIHDLSVGETVALRGPLGTSYPIDKLRGKQLIVVAGGFALTTLRSLVAYALENRSVFGEITIVYGARTPGMLMYRDELARWDESGEVHVHLTIDKQADGWNGMVGFVPDALGQIYPSPRGACALVSGPAPMLRPTFQQLQELGFSPEDIYTSLEMKMKCGVGMCGRCNMGPLYVCKDGPVFSLAQLERVPTAEWKKK